MPLDLVFCSGFRCILHHFRAGPVCKGPVANFCRKIIENRPTLEFIFWFPIKTATNLIFPFNVLGPLEGTARPRGVCLRRRGEVRSGVEDQAGPGPRRLHCSVNSLRFLGFLLWFVLGPGGLREGPLEVSETPTNSCWGPPGGSRSPPGPGQKT